MSASITVRVSEDLKRDLQQIAQEMGIPFSSLIVGSLTNIRKTRKVEFSANKEWEPSPQYMEELVNDPEASEVVFEAESVEDNNRFLTLL